MAELGFAQSNMVGTRFEHLVARAKDPGQCSEIHVYIEHDGTPWLTPSTVSDDPTPRVPVALELMGRDEGCRFYVGRPCYFEHHLDAGCDSRWWTDRRYSEEVVRSMAAVANRLVDEQSAARSVVLVGYSGGGTLAWLMARYVPSTTAVVTIAANLDVAAWTELHGYSPLSGSLDPARAAPLAARIRQVHLVGQQDRNVPPSLVRSVALRQPNARIVEIPGFDHLCCWAERWPGLLHELIPGASNP